MPDTRYLDARDKFLAYAWSIFSPYFDSYPAFEEQFDWIQANEEKNEFLRIASFYKFLVRDGAFSVQLDGETQVEDSLDQTYKFIAIVAFIEALYSHERFLDFYEWLSMRQNRAEAFPITDQAALARLYRRYKADYGATKRTERFFESLDEGTQGLLSGTITVNGEYKPIEAIAKLLYAIRSEFVHGAKLVLELTSGTMISVRNEQVIVSDLSLRHLMTVFERGLLQRFNFIPYKTGRNQ